MPKKRYTPTEIVAKLKQVDLLISRGKSIEHAIREVGVSEANFYRWRQQFGGLEVDQVKRLKQLERENARLRRAVCDLIVDKLNLIEATKVHFSGERRRRSTRSMH